MGAGRGAGPVRDGRFSRPPRFTVSVAGIRSRQPDRPPSRHHPVVYLRDKMSEERLTQAHGAMAEALVRRCDGNWTDLPAKTSMADVSVCATCAWLSNLGPLRPRMALKRSWVRGAQLAENVLLFPQHFRVSCCFLRCTYSCQGAWLQGKIPSGQGQVTSNGCASPPRKFKIPATVTVLPPSLCRVVRCGSN